MTEKQQVMLVLDDGMLIRGIKKSFFRRLELKFMRGFL